VNYSSRQVDSNQTGQHHQLQALVTKYKNAEYKKPVSTNCQRVFSRVEQIRQESEAPVILDSGCGTGMSTRILALRHPESLVIGVDKSAHRLAKGGFGQIFQQEANYILVNMNLVDFWQLCGLHEWNLSQHYLLYPNPWPKARHIQKRWYAHPVFPALIKLGGCLEVRCNWLTYAEEFKTAVMLHTDAVCSLDEYEHPDDLSLFERKYRESGHSLYRCRVNLG